MAETRLSSPPSFQGFEDYLKNLPGLADSSRQHYANYIRGFTKGLEPGRPVTLGVASAWLTKHPTQTAKASLIHYARYLNDRTLRLDIKDLRLRKTTKKPRTIPELEEFNRVIADLPIEEQFIARFMLYVGSRASENFTVRMEDIDEAGKVVIRDAKNPDKWREVYLPEEFRRELMDYLINVKGVLLREHIFYSHLVNTPENKRKRFWHKLNRSAWRVLGRGIPTHDFRRFCATFLIERTHDLEFVNRIMGHARLETTHVYTQYARREKDIRKAQALLSELKTPPKTTGIESVKE